MKPVVVKLGGSMAGHVEMEQWIAALAAWAMPVVIVPGGGPFADQVRLSQKRMNFSDAAAHAMAILAMDQFGIAIAERHPRLQVARSEREIAAVLMKGRVPVWLPSEMTRDADIEESWDVTSDSLAAWLARRLGSGHLLLCKQGDPDAFADNLATLVDGGVVDPMLPKLLAEDAELHIAGPSALRAAPLALNGIPGLRVKRRAIAEGAGP